MIAKRAFVEEYLRLKWEDGVEFTDEKALDVATTLLKELRVES